MKIAYIVDLHNLSESGILKKFLMQIEAWQRCGCEAHLFILLKNPNKNLNLSKTNSTVIQASPNHFKRLRDILRFISAINAWDPDILYLRFNLFTPFIDRLLSEYPTVVEINTDDIIQFKNTCSPFVFWVHMLTRDLILRKAKGFVPVTHEIAAKFERYNKPTLVVANGIDFSMYEPIPAPINKFPQLTFIGTPGYSWHGVDKIVEMAQLFPQWRFSIIGYDTLDGMAKPPDNLALCGYLSKKEYDVILRRTDVAIGTLALHRKGMNEACALKVREYLARGIPTIIAHRDTDFPRRVPFLLEIPNSESTIRDSKGEIERFVVAWIGRRINREDVLHLDSKQKALQQIEFFELILKQQEL
jgi:glycosyltransferase involved in cell wall biosynthesis